MLVEGRDLHDYCYPMKTDPNGRPYVVLAGHVDKTWKYVSLANTNETTVWDPTSGTTFILTGLIVSASANGTCTIRDNTAGSTIMVLSLLANTTVNIVLNTPIQSAAADNILTAQASAATQHVTAIGWEKD